MLAQLLQGEPVLAPPLELSAPLEATARVMAAIAPALSGVSLAILFLAIPISLFLYLVKDARWKIVFPAGIGFFLLARMLPFLFASHILQSLG